jgi:amino acid permease
MGRLRVSTLGNSPNVVVQALFIIAMIGGINAYFFSLIGRVCSWTGATSYRYAWERTVGPESSQFVAIVVTLKTAISCLAYSMILAESFQALGIAAGLVDVSRTEALCGVTFFAPLPLCLLRDLTALTPSSFLGLLGMGFASHAICIHSADDSYADGGTFLTDIPTNLQPAVIRGRMFKELSSSVRWQRHLWHITTPSGSTQNCKTIPNDDSTWSLSFHMP